MILTGDEEAMRSGERGDALRLSIEQQIAVGEFFGAERFVPVSNVHMMGDYEVMGDAGYAYLQRLREAGARVAIPASRNAQCVEYEFASRLRQRPELVAREKDVRRLLGELGIWTVDTCIGYQSLYVPRFREHVAWGDTGTVAYANAVLGARTNYESGPAAVAAAITGRTPEYGFHLDGVRRATARVQVSAPMRDVSDWGALGGVIGERVRDYWSVPGLVLGAGVAAPSPDDLKHLGASLASHGSLAMYHVVGYTPEAPDEAATFNGSTRATFEVTAGDIAEFYSRFPAGDGAVDLVVFSAPQLSLSELETIARAFGGRRVKEGVTVLITTNSMVRSAAERTGILTALEASGSLVLQGTCWYIMDPAEMQRQFGWKRVVTNSAKLANIIRAHDYDPVLRSTAACVAAAVAGSIT